MSREKFTQSGSKKRFLDGQPHNAMRKLKTWKTRPQLLSSIISKTRLINDEFHNCRKRVDWFLRYVSKPGFKCQPWFYQSLEGYSFIWLCEGA